MSVDTLFVVHMCSVLDRQPFAGEGGECDFSFFFKIPIILSKLANLLKRKFL